MIFGPRFYIILGKITNWRQSLFALVLATRQYENFALWAELNNNRQAANAYKHALQQCWEYHFDKFNHIDLEKCLDQFAPFIPEAKEDASEGELIAFDAAISLNAVVDAILIDTPEAINASKASMASVVRLCENRYPDKCETEEDLLDLDEISAEINYQVELYELVSTPRSTQTIMQLLEYALKDNVTNIGLDHKLTKEDFFKPEFVKQSAKPQTQKPTKHH